MSLSATATMTSALPQRTSPRPPPPSAPPSGPLPALPMTKTRKPLPDIPDEGDARPTSGSSSVATPVARPLSRSVTTTGVPTRKPVKAQSTPTVPTLRTTNVSNTNSNTTTPPSSAIPTPGKTVRKTTSIGAFPAPPKVPPRVNSLPPSPLSASTSTSDINGLVNKTKRDSKNSEGGGKKPKTRSSGYGLRSRASAGSTLSFGASPSLLNGTGDNNAISGSDSLLTLPSPPISRRSSANGSYYTDATEFEDIDEPLERGRPKSEEPATDRRDSAVKDNKGNVIVSMRVRPDAAADGGKTEGEWMVDGRRSLISYKGREGGDYRYDNVFSPHDQNGRVYDNAAKRLVRRVMEGYHGTVFAYGMTGTGKTFSMQGTANSPGVIPLAIADIFSYIREKPDREFLLRVSYLEIYNEKIYDLLTQSTPGVVQEQDIKLREDSKRGVYATPLKEEIVQSPNQLLRVIARGDLARRTSSTQFNARSSRSHAVVQIVVESRARAPSHGAYFNKEQRRTDKILPGGVLVSTLSLIDLAGSERAAENKERRTEGAHINKSLLTLGTVIARLSGEDEKENQDGTKPTEKEKEKGLKHLPYRDSKLTRLLQPALSGDSLVSILCTIQLSAAGTSAAAAGLHTGETLNTMKFASRAKNNIASHAKRNESNANVGDAGSRALLDRYRLEIQELRTQLDQQNQAKEEAEKAEEIEKDRKMEEELERAEANRHEEQMLEMQLARTALKERISHLNRLILSSKSLGVNSGRVSSMSLASVPANNRASTFSTNEFGRPVSQHSRDSVHSTHSPNNRDSNTTLDVPLPNGKTLSRAVSVGSITGGVMPPAAVSHLITEEDDVLDEEDEAGGSPRVEDDGEATFAQQNKMLQADLVDKTRYIATLEKRLLQARRTSHSRVSLQLANKAAREEGGWESILREKDKEIEELKAKLDDQTRMVNALRSAARRNVVEDGKSVGANSEATERPSTANALSNDIMSRKTSSRLSNRSPRIAVGSGHKSNPSTASHSSSNGVVNFSKKPLGPMALLSPTGSDKSDDAVASPDGKSDATEKALRRKSVDEMTMLLDQMIQDKVESGHVLRGERGSLRVKRDTVMERNGYFDATGGAENAILEVEEFDFKES